MRIRDHLAEASPERLGALVPAALLVLAAGIREVRLVVLVVLIVGFVIALRREGPVRWAWAAPIPIAVGLCWVLLPVPVADPSGADCTNPASPPAVWRLTQAALGLVSLAILAAILRPSPASLWLRRPRPWIVGLSVAAVAILAPLGLLLGATLSAPFFGDFALDLGHPAAFLPGLVFAGSNAIIEELAYRGWLTSGYARVIGLWPAVGLQAVVFAVAHGGPDFVSSPLPVVLAMAAGALVASGVVLRTRSLLLPIAAHTALDLPIYFYFACPLS